MREQISFGGTPVVGFGDTSTPISRLESGWILVPLFGLPLAAAGAGVGYLFNKPKTGAVIGGVIGGVFGLFGAELAGGGL